MSEGEGAEEKERAREAGPSRREESWALEEGAQLVLEGPQRGNVGYWRGCGGCGGRSALVRSVCTVMLGGDLDVATWV